MIRFHFHHTPNPMTVALMLEELGLSYEVVPLDTLRGEQNAASYRAINPNGKAPAIEDDGTRVFDSSAILLYLAEKHGVLLGEPEKRGELLSWLFWIASGLGPFSGQWLHLEPAGAGDGGEYARRRYKCEAHRHYRVLDEHLAARDVVVGRSFTVADVAGWGWVDRHVRVLGENGIDGYPHVKRWLERIDARPAVARTRAVARSLRFKSDADEGAARATFPSDFAA